jgi:phosphatidylglycerophosphate synthase
MSEVENRRPLKVRDKAWAKSFAAALARARVKPNQISAMSVVFAALAAGLAGLSGWAGALDRSIMLVLAAGCIQARLLCNLFDGMVAVEHGLASKTGGIWNELPDRIADALLFAGAGYGLVGLGWSIGPPLGWACAVLAVLTAYVRELGRGLGQPADFSGPMAKQHRMATLTGAFVLSAFDPLWNGGGKLLLAALVVIAFGTAWTVVRRVRNLAVGLNAQP